MPHLFLSQVVQAECGFELPPQGDYAVGQAFLPTDPEPYEAAKAAIAKVCDNQGHTLLGWRRVPTDNATLGESAIKTEPLVEQFFVLRATTEDMQQLSLERQVRRGRGRAGVGGCEWEGAGCKGLGGDCVWRDVAGRLPLLQGTPCLPLPAFALPSFSTLHCPAPLPCPRRPQMYVLRKLIEHKLRTSGITDDDCYICSLSSRTIVYKGQLTPAQVRWVRWVHCSQAAGSRAGSREQSRQQAAGARAGSRDQSRQRHQTGRAGLQQRAALLELACGQWSSRSLRPSKRGPNN